MHVFRLGEADRPTYQPLDPRAQVDVLALNLLRVCLPYRVRLCLQMPLLGTPAVGARARDTKRLQQGLELQKGRSLASSQDRRSHLARVVINGVP